MASTTFGDRDKGDNKSNIINNITDLGITAEDARFRVLTGCCIFCAEPLTPNKLEFYKEPLISGRPFICPSAKCQKDWDSMSLSNLQWAIHTRANFG